MSAKFTMTVALERALSAARERHGNPPETMWRGLPCTILLTNNTVMDMECHIMEIHIDHIVVCTPHNAARVLIPLGAIVYVQIL